MQCRTHKIHCTFCSNKQTRRRHIQVLGKADEVIHRGCLCVVVGDFILEKCDGMRAEINRELKKRQTISRSANANAEINIVLRRNCLYVACVLKPRRRKRDGFGGVKGDLVREGLFGWNAQSLLKGDGKQVALAACPGNCCVGQRATPRSARRGI